MKFKVNPRNSSEVLFVLEPGDLVALVDAFNHQNILSSFYEFPATGLLEIPWTGPLTTLFIGVFDEETGDIFVRFPQHNYLTVTDGDVIKLEEPALDSTARLR